MAKARSELALSFRLFKIGYFEKTICGSQPHPRRRSATVRQGAYHSVCMSGGARWSGKSPVAPDIATPMTLFPNEVRGAIDPIQVDA